MKTKIALASLIMAVLPLVASAATPTGKVGNVTVQLTGLSYTDSSNTITDTETAYKETYKATLVKTKYSNKEFIASLIEKGTLGGVVADWSLKLVEGDVSGIFALNKDGSAVYLGGQDASGYAINLSENVSVYSGNDTYTEKRIAGATQQWTDQGSYKTTTSVDFTLIPSNDTTFVTKAVLNHGESYKEVYDYINDVDLTNTYSVPASSITSITGDNGDDVILSGSINCSALKDSSDISAYQTAYDNAHS